MSYANMDGVPTQTAGTSEILASDWNTYVRDNFDSIKFGHVTVADNSAKSALSVAEGTMVYQLDNQKLFVYSGSAWVEIHDLDNVGSFSDAALNGLKFIDSRTTSTSYTVNQTSLSSATDIFASDITWTADGTTTYLIEVDLPRVESGSNAFTNVYVTDGGNNSVAAVGQVHSSGTRTVVPMYTRTYYKPSAGSVSINLRATYTTAQGIVAAGGGWQDNRISVFGTLV